MNNRAVLYLRYSSHSQNEQTIDTQRDICTKYAISKGLKIVGEYADKEKSGTNDKREKFQKMISDSKKRLFDFVIVYKTDRFARNRFDSATNKSKLNKQNIRVLSATENISNDPQGILTEAILEGFAEYNSALMSENIKNGLATNARKGLSIGGNSLPLGFRSIPETREIVLVEEEAIVIKKIFNMFKEKKSYADITRYLNLQGLKTSRGNEFGKSI